MVSEPVIDIRDLTKCYGECTALKEVTLQVPAGHIVGLFGPQGAGKSTILQILAGLLRPTAGTATIAGVDCVHQSREIKRLVGYLPNQFGSYDQMRVHEYLDFFGAAFAIPGRKRTERVAIVSELVGIDDLHDRFIDSLGHAAAVRVGIARSLLHDPRVLLLDQPASQLDPSECIRLRGLILKLAGIGKTVLMTGQSLPDLSCICNTVAILSRGRLRAIGTSADIQQQVSFRRLFEVQLLNADALPRAAETVREQLTTASDVVESPPEAILRFSTCGQDQELVHVLGELVRGGVPVCQFREIPMDLEDAGMTFASVPQQVDGNGPKGASDD